MRFAVQGERDVRIAVLRQIASMSKKARRSVMLNLELSVSISKGQTSVFYERKR